MITQVPRHAFAGTFEKVFSNRRFEENSFAFETFAAAQTDKKIDGEFLRAELLEKVVSVSNVHNFLCASHICLEHCAHYFFSLEKVVCFKKLL